MRQMRNKQVQQPLRYDGCRPRAVGRSRDIPRCGENYGRYAEIVIYIRERRAAERGAAAPRTDATPPTVRRRDGDGSRAAAAAAPQLGLEIAGNVCKGPLAPRRSFSCLRLHGISASYATRKDTEKTINSPLGRGMVRFEYFLTVSCS